MIRRLLNKLRWANARRYRPASTRAKETRFFSIPQDI
jgi:hypothetical protein